MICVSVREKRRCVIRIYIFLMVEMFYSFERCFTLFDVPLYSFTSVGVNRSVIWTPTVLSVLYACVLYFCICTCSAQSNMFHMERCFRNTLIIIIIIIILAGENILKLDMT